MQLGLIRMAVVVILARVPTRGCELDKMLTKLDAEQMSQIVEAVKVVGTHITTVMMKRPVLQMRKTVNMAKLMYLVSW